MLLHRKGKLTIAKSKSSRLSYSEVVSLPDPVNFLDVVGNFDALHKIKMPLHSSVVEY
jgi:hypothetical protein